MISHVSNFAATSSQASKTTLGKRKLVDIDHLENSNNGDRADDSDDDVKQFRRVRLLQRIIRRTNDILRADNFASTKIGEDGPHKTTNLSFGALVEVCGRDLPYHNDSMVRIDTVSQLPSIPDSTSWIIKKVR
jgi:hypothetical protein